MENQETKEWLQYLRELIETKENDPLKWPKSPSCKEKIREEEEKRNSFFPY